MANRMTRKQSMERGYAILRRMAASPPNRIAAERNERNERRDRLWKQRGPAFLKALDPNRYAVEYGPEDRTTITYTSPTGRTLSGYGVTGFIAVQGLVSAMHPPEGSRKQQADRRRIRQKIADAMADESPNALEIALEVFNGPKGRSQTRSPEPDGYKRPTPEDSDLLRWRDGILRSGETGRQRRVEVREDAVPPPPPPAPRPSAPRRPVAKPRASALAASAKLDALMKQRGKGSGSAYLKGSEKKRRRRK